MDQGSFFILKPIAFLSLHPKDLEIRNFNYELDPAKIALYPEPERGHSKLLIWKNGAISEDKYINIAKHLPADSLLVLNETKVIPARILFEKPSGGIIEIFCLEPFGFEGYAQTLSNTGSARWKCLIGGASKWKSGALNKEFIIDNQRVSLTVTLVQKLPDSFISEFSWSPASYTFMQIIEASGGIPLPPYIKRRSDEADKDRYQTVYANAAGSVAAPTAGLHFTQEIFQSLKEKNIVTSEITLHIGAGTFKPVTADKIEDHHMHSEWIEVSREAIQAILDHPKEIVAVGTTSIRTLESLYWMGVKCLLDPFITSEKLNLSQWEIYEAPLSISNIDAKDALAHLLKWMKVQEKKQLITTTGILIAPGYHFKLTNALITNFHQPQSTLLLLVAAIAGENWKMIYDYALESDFKFLSYGDGSLLYI